MKRFFTFFLAFVVAFSFFAFPFSARAAVNPAFIYSAMYSYLLSTGMQFNASSSSDSDVTDMMGDLYDEYLADTSSGLAVADYESGVSLTSLGQFVFNYAVVQPLQDFADWISTKFNLTSGAPDYTTVVSSGGGASGFFYDDSYPNANYYDTLNWDGIYASSSYCFITYENNNYYFIDEYTFNSGYITFIPIANGYCYFFVSSDTSSVPSLTVTYKSTHKTNGTTNTSYVPVNNMQVMTSKSGVSYYGAFLSTSRIGYTNFSSAELTPYSGTFNTLQNSSDIFTMIYSDIPAPLTSLAVKIGTEVIDRASQVDQDQSLIVDMGLSAGATITDAISGVSAGIADGSIATSVPVTSVVADAVIDTPVQPYPDVDSLGLPELGLALTTRFPFSIPWDISAIYSALSAPSEPPVKTFDLIPASVMARWGINANTSITIDLTEQKYAVLLAIIHWSCIIGFCLGLAVMTKRYVWTTGG